VKIREIAPDDMAGLREFWRRIGNPEIVGPENWRRRWSGKPLSFIGAAPLPLGWVMETDDGRIVGHFGNVPLVYEFRGQTLIAAVASDWDVEKEFRSASLTMMARYFAQPRVDLFLDTFGTTDACKLFGTFGGRKLPLPWYDKPLLWVLDYGKLGRSVFLRKGWPLGEALGRLAGMGLAAADGLRRRGRHLRARPGLRTAIATAFDGRFDEFWEKLRRQSDKLLLARGSRFLDWYYGDLISRDRSWVVTVERGGQMVGYGVCVRKDSPEIGLRRAWVTDVQGLDTCLDEVVAGVIAGAAAEARRRGIDVLEVVGFGSEKRAALGLLRPRMRTFPHALFMYKARDKALAAALENPACWDPCPADGADAF
jgi:hypothetical protein